jgi:elongation factor P hydroxylase
LQVFLSIPLLWVKIGFNQRAIIVLNLLFQPSLASNFSEKKRLKLIVKLFNRHFLIHENTVLKGGAAEPLYIPSLTADKPHQLMFRENFVSSALHEVAHWCIAGKQRRLQQDFGYWYQPDGRTAAEQEKFESVEIKPQALEWIFSNACGQKFTASADNLSALPDQITDDSGFKQALVKQVKYWCQSHELPSRAKIFVDALNKEFDTADPFNLEYYHLSYLV